MFKRELKYNLKSFLIWMALLIGMYLIIFLIYPSIVNSDSIKSIDEMMKIFPKEMLEMFNMDISSISTVYGWLKSEGVVFLLLITGCYAGIIGSNILLKEESDKTIEYLICLPITRKQVVINKFLVGLIYVILMNLLLSIFNFIGLTLSGDFETKQYLLLSITPIFPSIVIYSICMFISTFAHKTKKVLGISLGIVFLSYIFNVLSGMGESVKALKYISVYSLADVRNVILNVKIEPIMILISISLTALFFMLTLIRFQKKSLI